MKSVRSLLAALVILATFATAASAAGSNGGWNWTVAPYIWGTGMNGDVSIGPVTAQVDESFSDIVSHMDMGAMMRVEGTGRRWGMSLDVTYANLSEKSKPGDAEVTVEQFNTELDAIYAVNEHFDLLAGARFWKLNNDIDYSDPLLTDVDAERDWLDPVIGFQTKSPLSEKWNVRFRGDVGGFGVGSDLSYQVETLFGWHATKSFTLAFGWRLLDVKYDSGSGNHRFVYDMQQQGPELGFAFTF